MRLTHLRIGLGLLLPALLAGVVGSWSLSAAEKKAETKFTPEQVTFYEKQVLPILKESCFKCHSATKVRGGLRLDSRAALLKGGDLGPALLTQKLDSSPFLKAIQYGDDLQMPPSGKLPAEKIAVLTKWIKMGAPYSPGTEAIVKTPEHGGIKITEQDRNYWAYKPIARPTMPAVKSMSLVANPIDAFIQAKLEAKGIAPTSMADRLSLARRVCYDLTGLPPTPEQIDAFMSETRPDAYERFVDTLLASPAYGEKWGRHWLDLVRFAETNGYERDGPKPFAWRFRDYVIDSFNADKPYDRFVMEQLAGDELPGSDADRIIATGFYRLGLWDDEPADPKQARADEIDDWVTTVGQVFLGMSLNCARCHDHKKDPLAQSDYYRMVAFFEDVRRFSNSRDPRSMTNLTDISSPELRAKYEQEARRRDIRKADIAAQMRKIEDEAIKKMPADDQRASEGAGRQRVLRKLKGFVNAKQWREYTELRDERRTLDRVVNPTQMLALSVNNCLVRPPQTHVMVRGNPHALGSVVKPGFPVVLNVPDPSIGEPAKDARTSGRRTVLANWITNKNNPLTARVIANRLWQFHFGRGIVPTPSDFGKLGEAPTHPELLDWLAAELIDGDWHLKRLHRLILTSNTYRRSAKATADGLARDPANTLWWRVPMRRLSAEEVRDSMLAVSGELNRVMFGKGVYPTIPAAVLAGQSVPGSGWGKSPPAEQARRSVYVHVKRSLIVPILQNHDLADTDSSCPVRYTTTVPTQALGMLNGEFTNEQATTLADRLMTEEKTLPAQVKRAIRLTTGRTPKAEEVNADVGFVKKLKTENKLDDKAALRLYCLLALNTNEFMYLD